MLNFNLNTLFVMKKRGPTDKQMSDAVKLLLQQNRISCVGMHIEDGEIEYDAKHVLECRPEHQEGYTIALQDITMETIHRDVVFSPLYKMVD